VISDGPQSKAKKRKTGILDANAAALDSLELLPFSARCKFLARRKLGEISDGEEEAGGWQRG
jgi:hypothetical protein